MRRPEPLIILAEKVDGAALGHDRQQQPARHACRPPRSGRPASATAASPTSRTSPPSPAGSVITPEAGLSLESVEPEVFGRARRVIVTEDSTTFIEGAGTDEAVVGAPGPDRHRARPGDARDATSRACASAAPGCRASWRSSASAAPPTSRPRSACGAPRARWRPAGPRWPRASCTGGGTALLRVGAGAGRPRARGRPRRRRGGRARACSATRSTGSPPTPATTARRWSTRCGRCRTATASTRSPATSATSSRPGVIDPVRVMRAEPAERGVGGGAAAHDGGARGRGADRPAGRDRGAGLRRPRRGAGAPVVADLGESAAERPATRTGRSSRNLYLAAVSPTKPGFLSFLPCLIEEPSTIGFRVSMSW